MPFFQNHSSALQKSLEHQRRTANESESYFQTAATVSPVVTKLRIAAFIAASLIPLVALGCGIIFLTAHALINLSFLISFLLIPVGTIFLLKKLIFSSVDAFFKALAAILVLIGFAALFFISGIAGKYEALEGISGDSTLTRYEEIRTCFPSLPAPDELDDPQHTEYYEYTGSQFIFTRNANILTCQYTAKDYPAYKERLEDIYSFQTEPLNAGGTFCEPSAQIGDYHFRTLSVSDYPNEIDFPKKLILIATDDAMCEIAYIAFSDSDIDYIESLDEFILDSCGWKHIR